MKVVKTIYPWVDEKGIKHFDKDYHYGVRVEKVLDENGNEIEVEHERYKLHKVGTNEYYEHAVDNYPCKYTYECTDEVIESEKKTEEVAE